MTDEELRAQLEQLETVRMATEHDHARSRSIFADSPDAYLITDDHGLIREANRAAFVTFARESQILIGELIFKLFAQKEAPNILRIMASTSDPASSQTMLAREEGSSATINLVAVASRIANTDEIFWRFRAALEKESRKNRTREIETVQAAPIRILVLSQDAWTCETTVEAGQTFAAEVKVVDSAELAHEILKDFKAEVFFVDLWTVGEGAFDIITQLRARMCRPMPLGIAVSSSGKESTRAVKSGFHFFIVKPVSVATVQTALRSTLRVLEKRAKRLGGR